MHQHGQAGGTSSQVKSMCGNVDIKFECSHLVNRLSISKASKLDIICVLRQLLTKNIMSPTHVANLYFRTETK